MCHRPPADVHGIIGKMPMSRFYGWGRTWLAYNSSNASTTSADRIMTTAFDVSLDIAIALTVKRNCPFVDKLYCLPELFCSGGPGIPHIRWISQPWPVSTSTVCNSSVRSAVFARSEEHTSELQS